MLASVSDPLIIHRLGYLHRLQLGLVDRLGGLSDAIAEAKLLAGLPVDVDQVCWVS